MNHTKMVQNKQKKQENSKSSKEVRTKRKKRKLEETNGKKETNGHIEQPPAKKQKVENNDSSKKQSKKKILKQILKNEQKATSLKAVCNKFNEQIQIDNKEDNSIFLQTLWKISDKVSINTIITSV